MNPWWDSYRSRNSIPAVGVCQLLVSYLTISTSLLDASLSYYNSAYNDEQYELYGPICHEHCLTIPCRFRSLHTNRNALSQFETSTPSSKSKPTLYEHLKKQIGFCQTLSTMTPGFPQALQIRPLILINPTHTHAFVTYSPPSPLLSPIPQVIPSKYSARTSQASHLAAFLFLTETRYVSLFTVSLRCPFYIPTFEVHRASSKFFLAWVARKTQASHLLPNRSLFFLTETDKVTGGRDFLFFFPQERKGVDPPARRDQASAMVCKQGGKQKGQDSVLKGKAERKKERFAKNFNPFQHPPRKTQNPYLQIKSTHPVRVNGIHEISPLLQFPTLC